VGRRLRELGADDRGERDDRARREVDRAGEDDQQLAGREDGDDARRLQQVGGRRLAAMASSASGTRGRPVGGQGG
jgi:hypothetical protein